MSKSAEAAAARGVDVAATAGKVLSNIEKVILGRWFEAGDHIEALESLSSRRLPGREHVSYLLRVRNARGARFVIVQAQE